MAGRKNAQATFQPDSDVHISYEDQQKINKFAKLNAQMDDYKEEIKIKKNEAKNFEDGGDELINFDDDDEVPFHIGDVFINQNVEKTRRWLEDAEEKKTEEVKKLEKKCSDLKAVINDLKAQLYAKFGSRNINLEADED